MQKSKGFTLVELMIVVAIVAILVALAYPSYTRYVQQARRADAKNALLDIQLAEGKWRATHNSYTTTITDLGLTATSGDGYYTLSIPASSATSFSASAAPTGIQTGDSCGTFVITQAGPDVSTAAKKKCWQK